MMPTKLAANPHDARAIPLSDQEEETRTLMPESNGPAAPPVTGDPRTGDETPSQIAG